MAGFTSIVPRSKTKSLDFDGVLATLAEKVRLLGLCAHLALEWNPSKAFRMGLHNSWSVWASVQFENSNNKPVVVGYTIGAVAAFFTAEWLIHLPGLDILLGFPVQLIGVLVLPYLAVKYLANGESVLDDVATAVVSGHSLSPPIGHEVVLWESPEASVRDTANSSPCLRYVENGLSREWWCSLPAVDRPSHICCKPSCMCAVQSQYIGRTDAGKRRKAVRCTLHGCLWRLLLASKLGYRHRVEAVDGEYAIRYVFHSTEVLDAVEMYYLLIMSGCH